MNAKRYTILGWLVWKIGSRLAKRKVTKNRVKLGAAGATGLVLAGGALAAKAATSSES